jgi:cell division protein FtsB
MNRRPPQIDDAGLDRPKLPPRRRENPWLRRGLALITCVLLADALFGDRGLAAMLRVRRDHGHSRTALTQLKNENAALRERMRRLLEDPRTIEAVARQELGLVRPGEILVFVKDVN